jgi:hypothetical protein
VSNFTDPIKVAFGAYMYDWFSNALVGDTRAVAEFLRRPFGEAVVWAPGRMIDSAEEMLDAYRKNDTSQATQPKTRLPAIICAMDKSFIPAPPEYGRGLGDAIDVTIPDDSLERVFRMRAAVADVRTQIAIFAADEPTAKSLAMQLHLFMSAIGNRVFYSTYKLAGIDDAWPCQLELPDLMAMAQPTDVKNMTVLVIDVQARCVVPFLKAPTASEANDGQGSGNTDDPFAPNYNPSGYLTVAEVDVKSYPPRFGAPIMGHYKVTAAGIENVVPMDSEQP